ncbi:MAG: pentapeptide repeat-containing protein [Acidipropionibacterium sp.]|jgi:hypothetical protein|nr:pentapeptide repeat-containing protein [Acidipropionibacterium sp.]
MATPAVRRSPAPRPPAAPRVGGPLDPRTETPRADELVEDADITGARWSGADLDGVDLMSVRGRSVMAAQSVWQRSQCADVDLESADLAASSWQDAGWRRVRLSECRATGIELSGCMLEDVDITGCVLEMARFRFATLRRVRFTGCRLTRADFSSAQLEEVALDDCLLEGAAFHQVRIQGRKVARNRRSGPGLVIRGGSIEGLAGPDQLRGAAIDPLHLEVLGGLLATAVGISLDLPEE